MYNRPQTLSNSLVQKETISALMNLTTHTGGKPLGGYADHAREAVLANKMSSFGNARRLARAMRHQIQYEAYAGDVNAAVADCIALHKFAQHIEGKGLLVEQLVGVAIDAMATECALTLMKKTDVSPDGLLKLQKEFEQSITLRQPVINFDSEKAAWLDIIQRCFTDNGKGDGRMLGQGLPLMASYRSSFLLKYLTMQFPSRRQISKGWLKQPENLCMTKAA